MSEHSPLGEPGESPTPPPVDSKYPLVLNLHGDFTTDDWEDPESWTPPERPPYVPLNWRTCYFPMMEWRDGVYQLSDEALLQWFDIEIEQMGQMEYMTGESDGLGPEIRENAGTETIGDAYRLIVFLNQNGWKLKLLEPPGPFTPHDALRELRKIRDVLVAVCDGHSTGDETPDERPSETENTDIVDIVGQINLVMLDESSGRILAIANDRNRSSDERMREICGIDQRYYGKKSPFWAKMLDVTQQAIRNTDFWKNDRKQLLNSD